MIPSLVMLAFLAAGETDFPSEAVAEEFDAICLSQPPEFPSVEAAARNRGWTEHMPGNPTLMRAGTLAAPTLPWRRASFGPGLRRHGQQGCMIVLEMRTCDDATAVVEALRMRINRPPDEFHASACEAIWHASRQGRTIAVGHDGHGLLRLYAIDQVQTEESQ